MKTKSILLTIILSAAMYVGASAQTDTSKMRQNKVDTSKWNKNNPNPAWKDNKKKDTMNRKFPQDTMNRRLPKDTMWKKDTMNAG